MKTKRYSALILILLIAVLIASFFTGCKIGSQSSEASAAAEETTQPESAQAPKTDNPSAEDGSEVTADTGLKSENIACFYDNEAGFKINYPSDNVSFSHNFFVNTAGSDILLVVETNKISDLFSDETLGYDKETSIKDEAALKEGNYGEDIDFAYAPSKKVVKIGDIYAKEFIVFGRYEVCDTVFERKLIFYNNGYRVIITLVADKNAVIKSMPEYFAVDTENCGTALAWKRQDDKNSQDDFFNALDSGTVSETVGNWLDSYSYISKNLQLSQSSDSDVSNIVFSTIKDIQSDTILNYDILNMYPQFLKSDTISSENLQALNSGVKELADNETELFKKYIEEMGEPDPSDDRVYSNAYQGDYSFSLLGNRLVSLIYAVYTYTGGAHGSFTEFSFNYDIAAGREIMLSDIFRPDFDYLKFISDFSINDLKNQMLELGGGYDEEWLKEGAGPDENNFKTFALSKDSLVIKFAQYQVAAYAFGTFNVRIPYREFMQEINPESALAAYLN